MFCLRSFKADFCLSVRDLEKASLSLIRDSRLPLITSFCDVHERDSGRLNPDAGRSFEITSQPNFGHAYCSLFNAERATNIGGDGEAGYSLEIGGGTCRINACEGSRTWEFFKMGQRSWGGGIKVGKACPKLKTRSSL